MRYMMLIHHDEVALANAPQKQLWADYAAFNEALAKAGGQSSAGERLQPASATAADRNPPDGSPFALTADDLAISGDTGE